MGRNNIQKNLNDILNENVNRDNRELKQLRRRRRLQKTRGLMIKTTALPVHHAF